MNKSWIVVLAVLLLGAGAFGWYWYHKNPTPGPGPAPGPTPNGDVVIKVPANLSIKPGRLLKISAETNGKYVKWFSCSDDIDLVQLEAGKSIIFCTDKQGAYRVIAYTAGGDVPSDPAICVVTVGDPGPGPGPGPGPNPPPPPPLDPFLVSLNTAFGQEASPDKVAKLAKLQTLYSSAATTTVNDQDIKTVAQMVTVLHSAANNLVGQDLMQVRNAIRTELDGKLPTKASAPMDASTRKLCQDQFTRIADLLSKVK